MLKDYLEMLKISAAYVGIIVLVFVSFIALGAIFFELVKINVILGALFFIVMLIFILPIVIMLDGGLW